MIFGYARVSTVEQNLDLQIDALVAAGCTTAQIFTDRESGTVPPMERPGWSALWAAALPDDTIVIWRFDRLARGLSKFLDQMEDINRRGLHIVSLTEIIDTRGSTGRLVLQVFGALAEFERSVMLERVAAGMAAARARGQHFGRPAALAPAQVSMARKMRREGESSAAIGAVLGVSRKTVDAALHGLGPYQLQPRQKRAELVAG